MKILMLRFLIAYLVMVGLVHAQEKDPWIGKRVFTQFGAVLKVGNDVVDDEGRTASLKASRHVRVITRVYRVEHINGEWLWLKDENSGIAGWVQRKYVVAYEQAINFYTNQIRSNPQAATYNLRGGVWVEKGEYDIAIADYNEAIRLEPGEATYYCARGVSWDKKKDYDKAIADYNEAIRLDPEYALAYDNRGNAWVVKKEYDKAIASFNEAIRLNPKDALAFGSRGNAWGHKKEYDKAIADYNEAIRLDPKDTWVYDGRGVSWVYKKEYDKAISDYNEAIRLDPKNANAFRNRGVAWSQKKDYDKAIADYDEVIRLDSKDASAYYNRAWLWATCPDEKYRDGKRAVESATRACQLTEWRNPSCLCLLAATYAESGDFEKAVEWQEKALELYPDEYKKKPVELLDFYKNKKPFRNEN